MKRNVPAKIWEPLPCSYVALGCAGVIAMDIPVREDGYANLRDMNKVVRSLCDVKKYEYYARNERVTLEQYMKYKKEGRAIICVLGHFIYADFSKNEYWSFFDNATDRVVAVWEIN